MIILCHRSDVFLKLRGLLMSCIIDHLWQQVHGKYYTQNKKHDACVQNIGPYNIYICIYNNIRTLQFPCCAHTFHFVSTRDYARCRRDKKKKKKNQCFNGLSLITGFVVRPTDCAPPRCVYAYLQLRWLVSDW